MSRPRVWIGIVAAIAFVGWSANEVYLWHAMTRDCARVGLELRYRDSCFARPGPVEPEIDWTVAERRTRLWNVLVAPDWTIPVLEEPTGEAQRARAGACAMLADSVRAGDEPNIVAAVLAGGYGTRRAAAHLVAAIRLADDPHARARELLPRLVDGSDNERLFACLVWATWNADDYERQRRSFIDLEIRLQQAVAAAGDLPLPLGEIEAQIRKALSTGEFPPFDAPPRPELPGWPREL